MLTIAKALLGSKLFWGAALGIGALAWSYNWAVGYGEQKANVRYGEQILQLKQTITRLEGEVDALETLNDQRAAGYKTSLLYLQSAHQEALAAIGEKLTASERRRKQLEKDIEKSAKQLVSPKADAACVVPAGFVRLHDGSAEADQTTPSQATPISRGGQADDDSPSGIALSQVGQVIAINYQECAERGVIIKSWQEWYRRQSQAWEDANKIQAGSED